MIKTFFELFVLYILYKLIFDFIIPLYSATKQVKQKVNEMNKTMNEHMNKQQNQNTTVNKTNLTPKAIKDDYIDYEEVK